MIFVTMASPHINPWGYEKVLNYVVSTKYDGKPRRLYKTTLSCGHETWLPKHLLETRKACSIKCKARLNEKLVTTKCGTCFSVIRRKPSRIALSKSGLVFCNRKCKELAQSLENGILQISHYKEGKSVYRDRAFKVYGAKCVVCGYDELEIMLDVDHKDSNRNNNKIENLQVLCVWHHAYKTRVEQNWGRSSVRDERLFCNQEVESSNLSASTNT